MAGELGDWYRSIPLISRYWFTASIVLPLIAKFGLVSPYHLLLSWEKFAYEFQFWRPLTALIFYPITPQTGFHYLINLYFLYSYSTRLETGAFDGRPADYLFMLLFNGFCLVIIGFLAELFFLFEPLILSVMYIWCQMNKETIVQFWFGTQFKAMYLPWVLVGFNLIIRGGGLSELLGIVVGHIFYFLMFQYPQEFGGRQFISTPNFLYRYLPNRRGGVSGFGVPPASQRRNNDDTNGPRFPGRGQPLGQ